jgi:hypothetical protein
MNTFLSVVHSYSFSWISGLSVLTPGSRGVHDTVPSRKNKALRLQSDGGRAGNGGK